MTEVVHCKRKAYDTLIDRTTLWGNPFVIGRDGNREEVIEKYKEWFLNSPEAEHLRKNLHTLKGKILGCWCAPKACHGHILAKLVDLV